MNKGLLVKAAQEEILQELLESMEQAITYQDLVSVLRLNHRVKALAERNGIELDYTGTGVVE